MRNDKASALLEAYGQTKIVSSDSAADMLAGLLEQESVKCLLFCCAGNSSLLPDGAFQRVLRAMGRWTPPETVICGNIPPEPAVEDVRRIVAEMKKNEVTHVVAVG
ncbi:MAG: iron-containing alcohol dehydrogenase, partial [Lentisphaeria bacterium]|nr:iron-containing alcohol dehydrogenase [Lentisphaeria bacterium]